MKEDIGKIEKVGEKEPSLAEADANGTWLETHPLIGPLHRAATVAGGCKYRLDETESRKTIVYSARDLKITLQGEQVTLSGQYDIRSFLKLYRETSDDKVRKLLFQAAIPCSYCIDDKCTTFLMAEQRTIHYAGQSKKLCGPYRHQLTINVDAENLAACVEIVGMMLERVYPYMHKDMTPAPPDNITYKLVTMSDFYLVGFAHKHSPISISDEDFMSPSCGKMRMAGAGSIYSWTPWSLAQPKLRQTDLSARWTIFSTEPATPSSSAC